MKEKESKELDNFFKRKLLQSRAKRYIFKRSVRPN